MDNMNFLEFTSLPFYFFHFFSRKLKEWSEGILLKLYKLGKTIKKILILIEIRKIIVLLQTKEITR